MRDNIATIDSSIYKEENLYIEQRLDSAAEQDLIYKKARKAVKNKDHRFLRELQLQVEIEECLVREDDWLCFTERIWVLNHEPKRTYIMA